MTQADIYDPVITGDLDTSSVAGSTPSTVRIVGLMGVSSVSGALGTPVLAGNVSLGQPGGPYIDDSVVSLEKTWSSAKILEELNRPPLEILSFSVSPTSADNGSTATVTLSWTLSGTPISQSVNGQTIETNRTSCSFAGVTTQTTYTLTVSDGRTTETRSVIFYFRSRAFWGVSDAQESYDSAFIAGLNHSTLTSSRARTITATAGRNEYIYYCIPSTFGTPQFTVSGFTGGFTRAGRISYTNAYSFVETYDIWKSDNDNLGETTVIIS